MSETKLKPCPFCGTQMKNCGAPIWEDYCPNKSCTGHRDEMFERVRQRAIEKKNRDDSLASHEARIAELEEALRQIANNPFLEQGWVKDLARAALHTEGK